LVDKDVERQIDLQAHVEHNIFRQRGAVSSENAQVIVQRRKFVLEKNEPSSIRLVEPPMLPTSEAEGLHGIPLLDNIDRMSV
jgi:hypothetical protein